MQEGVAMEAIAFAGHFKLDNLILIYDSNDVTLDAMAKMTQSEDTAERFRAYGYNVHTVDGHNIEAFFDTFEAAKHTTTGKPQFIVSRTLIGKGIPEIAGTQKAHGEAGAKFVDAARKALGLPDEKFYVSKEVHDYFAGHRQVLKGRYLEWQESYSAWKKANPDPQRFKTRIIGKTETCQEKDLAADRNVPAPLLRHSPEVLAGWRVCRSGHWNDP